MKIEKINSNKAKISLTLDELKERKITLNDIKLGKAKAQDFFFKLLEDANLSEEFESDSKELLIEACKEDDLLTITISKIFNTSSAEHFENINTSYNASTCIYSFTDISALHEFIKIAETLKLDNIKCYLFLYNSKFYLIFNSKSVSHTDLAKVYLALSEYATIHRSKSALKDLIVEYGKPIFKNKALRHILEKPSFLT